MVGCASCGKPFLWLNGERYSSREVEEFAHQCERCGGWLHSECGVDPDVLLPDGSYAEMELCTTCEKLLDYDTRFLPGVSDERQARTTDEVPR